MLRVATCNGRKSNIAETAASRKWVNRWPVMRRHLAVMGASVIGGQEWTVTMCNDFMEAFPNWTYAGGVKAGNCPIFWNTMVLQAMEGTLLEKRYPSGDRERYMTLVRLESRQLDWGGWFGSMHLAVESVEGSAAPKLRALQMAAIVADVKAWMSQHPHPEDGKPNLIMCADTNDSLGDNAGVRKIAYDLGEWKGLRRRLPLGLISGDTFRSANHWKHTASLLRDSKAIDEIFTSGITLERAALRRTCTDVYPIHASDHNTYSADIIT